MFVHFFTIDLNPRTIAAKLFDCGPKWLFCSLVVRMSLVCRDAPQCVSTTNAPWCVSTANPPRCVSTETGNAPRCACTGTGDAGKIWKITWIWLGMITQSSIATLSRISGVFNNSDWAILPTGERIIRRLMTDPK